MNYKLVYLLEKYLGDWLCGFLRFFISFPTWERGSSNTVRKIVFVKFIEQGAIVQHLHTFQTAQKHLGEKNVFFCTFSSNREFVESLNVFEKEQVVYIQNDTLLRFIFSYFLQVIAIRKKRIDASVDLEFLSTSTMVWSFLSSIKYRTGFIGSSQTTNRDSLVSVPVPYSEEYHVSESGWILLEKLLPEIQSEQRHLNFEKMRGRITLSEKGYKSREIEEVIGKTNDRFRIIIHPNFNDPLPLRSWPKEKYVLLITELTNRYANSVIIITGREDEYIPAMKFIEQNKLNDIYNLCGKTEWTDLLRLYNDVDLLVCSDSGPAHFASIFSLKTVVLFGPETPKLYKPLGENVKVLYKELPCSPCFTVYNHRTSGCSNNICMTNINVEEVLSEINELVASEIISK